MEQILIVALAVVAFTAGFVAGGIFLRDKRIRAAEEERREVTRNAANRLVEATVREQQIREELYAKSRDLIDARNQIERLEHERVAILAAADQLGASLREARDLL